MVRVDAATGWSLGLWFILGLVPTVGQSVGWRALLNHQGLAAWVQAVGSIAAIVAAIQIASNQHRRDVERRKAEAAGAMALRCALIKEAARWLMNAADSLVPSNTPDYVAVQNAENLNSTLDRLDMIKRALDSIEFSALQHPTEFLYLSRSKAHVDNTLVKLRSISGFVPKSVQGEISTGGAFVHSQGELYELDMRSGWLLPGG